MAIIKLGATIVGVRGTIGGLTFSANKAGPHAKILSFPPARLTSKQAQQRGNLSTMAALWRSLSSAQQAAWDALAASPPEIDYNSLGDQYFLSGFQWFCRICLRRRRTGQSQVLIAPTNAPVDPPDTFTLTLYPANGDADRCVIGYTADDFLTHYAIFEMALAPGQGNNAWTTRYLMTWEALGEYSTYSEAGANYYANFPNAAVGDRFFARLYRQHSDAIRSTPLVLYEDVVAYP